MLHPKSNIAENPREKSIWMRLREMYSPRSLWSISHYGYSGGVFRRSLPAQSFPPPQHRVALFINTGKGSCLPFVEVSKDGYDRAGRRDT